MSKSNIQTLRNQLFHKNSIADKSTSFESDATNFSASQRLAFVMSTDKKELLRNLLTRHSQNQGLGKVTETSDYRCQLIKLAEQKNIKNNPFVRAILKNKVKCKSQDKDDSQELLYERTKQSYQDEDQLNQECLEVDDLLTWKSAQLYQKYKQRKFIKRLTSKLNQI